MRQSGHFPAKLIELFGIYITRRWAFGAKCVRYVAAGIRFLAGFAHQLCKSNA